MRLAYYCHFGQLTGYARAAHDYLLALHRHRPDIELDIHPLAGFDPGFFTLEPRYRDLAPLVTASTRRPDVAVIHTTPARLAKFTAGEMIAATVPAGVPRVAYTTWETFDLPTDLLRSIMTSHQCLLVPSGFCIEALGEPAEMPPASETWAKAAILPHCYDPGFWQFAEPPAPSASKDDFEPFRFYSIGAWSERKNPLGVIKAYLHAFTVADPVQLVISSTDADINSVRSLLARSGISQSDWPRIHVADPQRKLNEAELLDLHAGAHCFVSATRGEGFGLGHFEAAVMGRSIITPMWGGHEEYLEPLEGRLDRFLESQVSRVEYHLAPVFPEPRFAETVGGMAKMIVSAAVGLSCKQAWAEPDLLDMANLMRRTLTEANWDGQCGEAPYYLWSENARAKLKKHTYEPIANRFAAILEEVRHG